MSDTQHSAVLDKWAKEDDRKRARAEALEANFTKTLANMLKQENVKKVLARDTKEAISNPNRVNGLRRIDEFAGSSRFDEDMAVTGLEPRPWEDD